MQTEFTLDRQVFQAACQDGLRHLIRGIGAEHVADLAKQDLAGFREELGAEMEAYGVKVSKVTVTFAQPSAEVIQSLEARQLAAVQQAEQAEKQALAQRRQKDLEDLARQEVMARIEREKELLQLKIQEAKLRQQLVELEAEAEELKLAKLEQRLKDYPNAAKWLWEGEKLEVSRALAGNTRAVLQVGRAIWGDTAIDWLARLTRVSAPTLAASCRPICCWARGVRSGLPAVAPFYGMVRYEAGLDATKKPRHARRDPRPAVPAARALRRGGPSHSGRGRRGAEAPAHAKTQRAHEVHIYPGAGHAFLNDTRPDAYRPQAAEAASGRLVPFLRRELC